MSTVALQELKDAVVWYSKRGDDVADRFTKVVDLAMDAIEAAPHRFPALNDRYRYVQLRPFPYIITFNHRGDAITVHRIRHTSQRDLDPED
jgi:plasmid stabilization system protein ParE